MTTPNSREIVRLSDERGRLMTELDEITETVRSRPEGQRQMTQDERDRHTYASRRFEEIGRQIDALGRGPRGYSVPNVNRLGAGDAPPVANRSLDELLWATASTVPAGEITRTGGIAPDPRGARNRVERVSLGAPGRYAPRIDELAADHRGAVRAFQETVADMATWGLLVDRSARTSAEGFEAARTSPQYHDRWVEVCRAMDVDTSGEGGTWVPTGIGASLHEKVRAAGKVAPLFARIDLPSNPWKWPIEGADVTAYRVAEPTGDSESAMTASTPGTVAATFDAEIFGARTLISRSLDADSAVVMVPFLQAKIAQAFVDAEEKTILDGDSDGTHQDSDVGASTTDVRSAWDGLRKKALAETSQATTTTSAANLALVRKSMGKWGVNPADLAFIVGVSSYQVLMSDTNLLTVDKMGPQATILNGQVGSLYGCRSSCPSTSARTSTRRAFTTGSRPRRPTCFV